VFNPIRDVLQQLLLQQPKIVLLSLVSQREKIMLHQLEIMLQRQIDKVYGVSKTTLGVLQQCHGVVINIMKFL
jgi:hypothetical protein